MLELLLKLEMSLWIEETRNNIEFLDKVLHKDFKEFGKSGKVFNKEDILKDTKCVINAIFPFEELDVKSLSEETYLITYVASRKDNNKIIKTNRSSIWIGDSENIQLIFHQGTLVNK